MSDEVLIKVEAVSKKFCRSLKRSLWYGLQDIAGDVFMRDNHERNLRKHEFWAVKDVSFELRRGECLGLIGLNGAGKTTLLRMLNGLIKPDHGRITMHGRVGGLIALGAGFNPILTGRENIYVNASVLGLSKQEIDVKFQEIIDFAEIGQFIDSSVQSYSSGMQVRLGFAVATALKPDVLLLDEVLAVGDLQFTLKCLNRMTDILRDTAVIFVSHNMEFVSLISTQVMVMQQGRTICYEQDPSKGIDFYYRQFSLRKEKQALSTIGIDLLRAQLIDPSYSGKALPFIPHGGSLALEFEFALHKSVKQLALAVLIHGKEPRELLDAPTGLNDTFFDLPAGRHVFRVKLRNLYLNAGVHSVTICASDKGNSGVQLRVDNVASFQMTHSVTSWAPYILPSEWNYISSAH